MQSPESSRARREVRPVAAASSSVPLDLDSNPLIVAEEMNTTTRVEHFRNLVRERKYDEIMALAKKLVNDPLAHARPVLRHSR